MTVTRRTALQSIAASGLLTSLPGLTLAQGSNTLQQIKDRGSLRVGVTQAPPGIPRTPRPANGRPVSAFRWGKLWLPR